MKNNIKKFSFQGVDGAYSQLAGKNIYPDAESVPCNTFEEMFDVVKNNQVDCAIVPIENSRAGRVADTQRLIPESNLKIIGEYFLKINHCLLSTKDSDFDSLKRVHSHEQALAQCRSYLINKNISMIVAADTAGAAKYVAELGNKEDCAIASELAAKIYNLKIASSRLAGKEPFENPKVIDIVSKTGFAFYTINGKPYLSIKKFDSKKEYKFKIQSKKETIRHLLKKTMYWAHRELIFEDDVRVSKSHLEATKILLEPEAYKKEVAAAAEHELIKETKSLLLRKVKQLKLEKNMFDKDIVRKEADELYKSVCSYIKDKRYNQKFFIKNNPDFRYWEEDFWWYIFTKIR